MFGKNPIRSISRDAHSLRLTKTFYTIQGEGPEAGRPAVFIRLAGCNLACTFCDTEFEEGMSEAIGPAAIMARVLAVAPEEKQRRLVVMTGGEPMRQNWGLLGDLLVQNGTRQIQVETAGTLWQYDDAFLKLVEVGVVTFVCSPKTPKVHPEIIAHCRDWKYVIRQSDHLVDGLPATGTQEATQTKFHPLYRPPEGRSDQIWLSPCDEYSEATNKLNRDRVRDLCLLHGFRVSLQTHKLLDVE